MSQTKNHNFFLDECFNLASSSVEVGNHPFGALITLDGQIRVRQENEVNTRGDVTAHAELLLIQKAQRELSSEELAECTLYTSTEPCAMCAGAIYWAGIKNVVYACKSEELNKIVGGSLGITCEEVFATGIHITNTTHINGDLKFKTIHKNFW
jgi:tRNA(Arg) A34 adenosine deaminase TadA